MGLLACSREDDKPSAMITAPGPGSGSGAGVRKQQVAPPVDLKAPPADATKTASGLIYKKLAVNTSGQTPKRNDTVLINYTGWRQETGETFFTNQGRGEPMPLNLSQTAPGFTEALQQLRTGEKAVLWMPPNIGYKTPPAKPETLVYLVEVVDLRAAPAVPEDVARPPANARALKLGIKTVEVRPGTGKEPIGNFDSVTYVFTAWDGEGRMLDSLETFGKHPTTAAVYKEPPGIAEMLMSMTVGERARFWVDAAQMTQGNTRPPAGLDKGPVCVEVEVSQVTKSPRTPPMAPADVAKPPADAKKTAKGVFYRVLAAGPGKDPRHPKPTDTVKVEYTGWTTDGKMFDSSYLRAEPSMFNLRSVVAGWTDGMEQMTAGDRMRFWIPKELAYRGAPGKPEGMLVFDIELIGIEGGSKH